MFFKSLLKLVKNVVTSTYEKSHHYKKIRIAK